MLDIALYLIPVNISEAGLDRVLPEYNATVCRGIRHFIVENIRTARRFLRNMDREFPIDECEFYELNGHTDAKVIPDYLAALRQGMPMGVMSEAGCPAVADPGAQVVEIAQREGLKVIPLVGPSSILMALMASGFNGQGFAFQGYLPVKPDQRSKRIKELESMSRKYGQTQIFIETPYRNAALLEQLSTTLHPDTLVCVASNITDPTLESIVTLPARKWRSQAKNLGKYPAIFLLHSI
jgi:16S rRNA (cytidine1402-2'-O)-methyltransferase